MALGNIERKQVVSAGLGLLITSLGAILSGACAGDAWGRATPGTPNVSAALDRKLTAQWARYEAARTALLERLGSAEEAPDRARFSRQEWEALLAPPPGQELSALERRALLERQEARIRQAKKQARAASSIDLDRLRALPAGERAKEISRFCAKLPKGGMLHIHPSGTLDRGTVKRLLSAGAERELDIAAVIAEREEALYADELRWLRGLPPKARFASFAPETAARFMDFFFLPPGTHPFTRFDVAFSFVWLAMPEWEQRLVAFRDFGKRAAEQGVSYVEFTTGVSQESLPYYQKIIDGYETEFGLTARLNASFYRLATQEELLKKARELLKISSPLLVGIDLLGNETHSPTLEDAQLAYGTVLAAVEQGKSRLRRTMHAGELGDPRNPRDALILGAERLGHGVKLGDDPLVLEYAVTRRVPVEVNLTSNVRLRAIKDVRKHPFLRYLRLGLPVSLSTDDEGMFETDINRECELAVSSSDVAYAELRQMALNSITTSFADTELKARLEGKLRERLTQFEKEYQLPKPAAAR